MITSSGLHTFIHLFQNLYDENKKIVENYKTYINCLKDKNENNNKQYEISPPPTSGKIPWANLVGSTTHIFAGLPFLVFDINLTLRPKGPNYSADYLSSAIYSTLALNFLDFLWFNKRPRTRQKFLSIYKKVMVVAVPLFVQAIRHQELLKRTYSSNI
ncbi:MAG: hypothetical protein K940chlam6_00007 [Chlamydiae bacterium]|nr:hypothetical protein [Chlamydiota bacterium]